MERTESADLVEVSVQCGSETFTLRQEESQIDTGGLLGVSGQFEGSSDVIKAITMSRSGRVTVDFPASSGTGQTRSNVLLADLLLATLPLLCDLSAAQEALLGEYLSYEAHSGEALLASIHRSIEIVSAGYLF